MHLQGVFHGVFAFLTVGHVNAEMDTRDVQAIRKLELSPSAIFTLEEKEEGKKEREANSNAARERGSYLRTGHDLARNCLSARADLSCMHQIDVSRDNPSVIDGLATTTQSLNAKRFLRCYQDKQGRAVRHLPASPTEAGTSHNASAG